MNDSSETLFPESGRETVSRAWTVGELNAAVRSLLENSMTSLWLTGEVGNITIHRSGHVYLTLKDDANQIRAVYFNGGSVCSLLKLRDGVKVMAFGKIAVYAARGEYQFNIRTLQLCGIGELQQRFEILKQKLAALGYFEPARKKPIPFLPQCIGVVSSSSGAALKDFLKIALARFPGLHIRICPAAVQGRGAELKLAKAVRFFNRVPDIDVIVVTRGGGSLEDLWPFNEEVLAQAIFESRVPVVSAVGHEIDFTICDFVADFRAPTPSGAAEAMIPDGQSLTASLESLARRADSAVRLALERASSRLTRMQNSKALRDTAQLVQERMQTTDLLMRDAETVLKRAVETAEYRLRRAEDSLRAYSPYGVLERGYALVTDPRTGKTVSLVESVTAGNALSVRISDGILQVTLDKGEKFV